MQVKTTKTPLHINQDGSYQKQTMGGKKKEEKDTQKETIKCGKDVEKLELLYATGRSVKQCNHYT